MSALAEDLEEIRKLLARYCFTLDERDADGWAALFTEDGSFHGTLGEPLIGREALRQITSRVPDGVRHLTMNEVIEVEGDTATARAYVLVTRESPPIVSGGGTYEDTLSRTADGWRFSRRTFRPH
jgi:uncharacterized protein (TIGR02246 family)